MSLRFSHHSFINFSLRIAALRQNARRPWCAKEQLRRKVLFFLRRRESIYREPAFSFRLVAIISATDTIVSSILGRDDRGGRERERERERKGESEVERVRVRESRAWRVLPRKRGGKHDTRGFRLHSSTNFRLVLCFFFFFYHRTTTSCHPRDTPKKPHLRSFFPCIHVFFLCRLMKSTSG